jgi:predicted SAM-dependent methyltransferase
MLLNLGCGSCVKPGWINLDLEPVPGAIKCDLSKGIPYPDNSVKVIYSEHMIEHLTWEQGLVHLKECYRVLEPGGVIRISTPDLESLVANYKANRKDAYMRVGFLPTTSCQMLNQGMRSWGHQYVYDTHDLILALHQSGFPMVGIGIERSGKSDTQELKGVETRPDLGDLIVEATK